VERGGGRGRKAAEGRKRTVRNRRNREKKGGNKENKR
jgi:hypothetical protein